jgi:hypothetical protein
MTDSTRRNFLIATGASAAAVGVAAALPTAAGASTAGSAGTPAKPLKTPKNAAPLVAHVSDPSTGEVSLLVGEREVKIHDHDLVARLSHAAGVTAKEV